SRLAQIRWHANYRDVEREPIEVREEHPIAARVDTGDFRFDRPRLDEEKAQAAFLRRRRHELSRCSNQPLALEPLRFSRGLGRAQLRFRPLAATGEVERR